MNVSYENSQGTILNLNDGAYFVNENDLRDFAWDYTAINRPSGRGGRMRSFSRPVAEKTINISIRGTATQFAERMNALHALTEVDILAKAPGKLWYGDQYLTCYLGVASEIGTLSERGHFAKKALTVAAVEPFWSRLDGPVRFNLAGEGTQQNGKKYAGKYPYKYGSSYQSSTLINSHYAPCPIILVIYGTITNPQITIGGNVYAVNTEIASGERVEINQTVGTIYKINDAGVKTSVFNSRDKTNDIFKYVPVGASAVVYSGLFSFDIVMVQQRSEPLWT
jgi:hypothetical protein